jgi:hypothetical protein
MPSYYRGYSTLQAGWGKMGKTEKKIRKTGALIWNPNRFLSLSFVL